MIHDIAPEGMITLAKTNPTSKGWFKSFPWAHPDPTLPAVIYNNEKPGLDRTRCALGADPGDRYRARGDGLLPRRSDHLRASTSRRPGCIPSTTSTRWSSG